NWLSLQTECAEASVLLRDATYAAPLYERLLPYAGRPATAGRAVSSYGAIDRALGGLAALLGREGDAVRHLEAAIRLDDALGGTRWCARRQGPARRSPGSWPRSTGCTARTKPASRSRRPPASCT